MGVIDSTGEKIQDIFADESPVSKLHNVTEESKSLQAEKEKNVAISLERKEYSKEKSEEKSTVMEPRYDRVREKKFKENDDKRRSISKERRRSRSRNRKDSRERRKSHEKEKKKSRRSRSKERKIKSRSREKRFRSRSKERKGRSWSKERKGKSRSKERSKSRQRKMSRDEILVDRMRSDMKEERLSRRYKSPSPQIIRKKSLSPGTKEILAYKAEQERKKASKSKKEFLYSDDEVEALVSDKSHSDNEMVVNKGRHVSGDSHEEVERLRLQALNTLKSRDNSDQSDYKSPKKKMKSSRYDEDDDDDDDVYVKKKVKKSKKKRDKFRSKRTFRVVNA